MPVVATDRVKLLLTLLSRVFRRFSSSCVASPDQTASRSFCVALERISDIGGYHRSSFVCAVCACVVMETYIRGSQRLQNLVAISERYCRSLLTSKASCIGNNGKIGYSIRGLLAKVKDTVANG